MAKVTANDIQVLVVGAGPTGLMMAGELARRGVTCRIIDKADGPSMHSKALGVQARTVEIFAQIGLADEAIARGNRIYGGNVYYGGQRIVHFSMDELDSPYPFILVLPQSETEKLLTEHLESYGRKVERSVELLSLKREDNGVRSVLRHADGKEEEVTSSFVVACDGAHSTVRHLLHVAFDGAQFDEFFCLADCYADCPLPQDEGHVFMHEQGIMGIFPIGKGQIRAIVSSSPDSKESSEPLTLDYFQRMIDERGAKGTVLKESIWMTTFSVSQRKVKDYVHGRIYLAGDAAHIHSPVGGQGMNTGIQDAYNLAWKIALVVNGHCYSLLLESYQAERYGVARDLLLGTELATKVITLRNPIAQRVRNHLMSYLISQEVVQERLRRNVSEIMVSYRNSPIVSEHHLKLTNVQLIANPRDARPTLRQWFDFGSGPRPGDRAPDAKVIDRARKLPTSVYETIRGTGHTLLLVADTTNTLSTLKGLAEIGRLVEREYADLIKVVLVISGDEPPRELVWNRTMLLDPNLSFHHRYGAESECLYLIRPDGYVGFRSQPPEFSTLQQYLRHIFIPDELNEEY